MVEFIDEAYRIITVMGVPQEEKVELGAYQLKGMAKVWFDQWEDARIKRAGWIKWEKFKGALLNRFFPLELREQRCKNSST